MTHASPERSPCYSPRPPRAARSPRASTSPAEPTVSEHRAKVTFLLLGELDHRRNTRPTTGTVPKVPTNYKRLMERCTSDHLGVSPRHRHHRDRPRCARVAGANDSGKPRVVGAALQSSIPAGRAGARPTRDRWVCAGPNRATSPRQSSRDRRTKSKSDRRRRVWPYAQATSSRLSESGHEPRQHQH